MFVNKLIAERLNLLRELNDDDLPLLVQMYCAETIAEALEDVSASLDGVAEAVPDDSEALHEIAKALRSSDGGG